MQWYCAVCLAALIVLSSQDGAAKSTCSINIAGAGATPNLVCDFHQDMQTNEGQFGIYRYLPKYTGLKEDKREPISVCSWNKTSVKYTCTSNGEEINLAVTSTLTWPLTAVHDEADYACEVLPTTEDSFVPCTFKPDSLVKVSASSSSSKPNAGQTAGIVIGVVVVVAVVCAVSYFVYRKRCQQRAFSTPVEVEAYTGEILHSGSEARSLLSVLVTPNDDTDSSSPNDPRISLTQLSHVARTPTSTERPSKDDGHDASSVPQPVLNGIAASTVVSPPSENHPERSDHPLSEWLEEKRTFLSDCNNLTDEAGEQRVDRLLKECKELQWEIDIRIDGQDQFGVPDAQADQVSACVEQLQHLTIETEKGIRVLKNLQETLIYKRIMAKMTTKIQGNKNRIETIQSFLAEVEQFTKGLSEAVKSDGTLIEQYWAKLKTLSEVDSECKHHDEFLKRSQPSQMSEWRTKIQRIRENIVDFQVMFEQNLQHALTHVILQRIREEKHSATDLNEFDPQMDSSTVRDLSQLRLYFSTP